MIPFQGILAVFSQLQAAAISYRPPQIDTHTALAYRRDAEKLLASRTPAERKQFIRACVQDMKLAPERFEVEVTYRIPEPVMNTVVAGAGFEPATSGL